MFPGCRSTDDCHRPSSPGGGGFPHRSLDFPGLGRRFERQMPNASRPFGLGVPSWRQFPGSGPVFPITGASTGCPLGPVRLVAT
eukprot:8043449-Heterocapsa_arctica.AAC.1